MLERQNMLKELAEEFSNDEDDFRKKQRAAQLGKENKELEELMSKNGGPNVDQSKMLEKFRSEIED